MNLKDHPQFQQMQQDIALANQAEEQERQATLLEQQRLRQNQAQLLHREYTSRVSEYEELRKMVHEKLGEMWGIVQDYHRLTSQNPPTFPENVFMSIDVPSLIPNPSPHHMPNNFSTTRASVMGYFSSTGRTW